MKEEILLFCEQGLFYWNYFRYIIQDFSVEEHIKALVENKHILVDPRSAEAVPDGTVNV